MSLDSVLGRIAPMGARSYALAGALSLVKALAVRRHRVRCRRELFEAGLFFALAALVRTIADGGGRGGR